MKVQRPSPETVGNFLAELVLAALGMACIVLVSMGGWLAFDLALSLFR